MSLIDLNVGLRYFGCVNFVFRCCPNPLPSPLVGAVRLGHVPNRSRLCGLCGDAGRGWVRMMSLRGGWRRAPSRSCSLQLCLTAWVACARELWQQQKQNEGGLAGLRTAQACAQDGILPSLRVQKLVGFVLDGHAKQLSNRWLGAACRCPRAKREPNRQRYRHPLLSRCP